MDRSAGSAALGATWGSVRSRSPTVTVSLSSRRSRQTTTSAASPTAAIETMLIRWFRSMMSTPAKRRTTSPSRMPALAAGEDWWTLPIQAPRGRSMPSAIGVFLEEFGIQIHAQAPPGDPAMSDQLVHDPAGQIDRDAEADPFVAAAVGRDRVVDPDHLALHVDERAARIAGVDRGVGLEEVLVHRHREARPSAARGR